MSLSVLLAQRFFRLQYQREACSAQELWSHYGTTALSGCQLWESQADFETTHLNRSQTEVDEDWAVFIQNYRLNSLHRQHFAQFFSPIQAITHILDELPNDRNSYLDPACGAGCFLVQLWKRFERKGEKPESIIAKLYGVDLDPDLVALTRFRLFQQSHWSPTVGLIIQQHIQHGDALLYRKNGLIPPDDLKPIAWSQRFPQIVNSGAGFQVIAGNPPFLFLSGRGSPVTKLQKLGRHEEAQRLKRRLSFYKTLHPQSAQGCSDLYKYFIQLCTEILSPDGFLGLILPSSWIRLARYEDVRQIFLQAKLYRIEEFDRKHFPQLTVPSSIVFCGRYRETIQYIDHQNQQSLSLKKESPFALYQSLLVEKLFSTATCTLGDICRIREGLHDYRHDEDEKQLIGNFILSELSAFQPPPIELIRRPKHINHDTHSGARILLRKTGDQLIGALIQDETCCLTHQNCYVLKPCQGFSPNALEILINSMLMTYLYQSSPFGQRGRVMAQLRIWGLQKLPIPKSLLDTQVQKLLLDAHERNQAEVFLLSLFQLSPIENQEIREGISSLRSVNLKDDRR